MPKYNKTNDPFIKAREYIEIDDATRKSHEATLKLLNKQMLYRNSFDMELLQFGTDLFNHGHSLEEVKIDLELCEAKREIDPGYNSKYSMVKYDGLDKVPSFRKMIAVVDNPALFNSIENGYNIASRRSFAKELDEKYGKAR